MRLSAFDSDSESEVVLESLVEPDEPDVPEDSELLWLWELEVSSLLLVLLELVLDVPLLSVSPLEVASLSEELLLVALAGVTCFFSFLPLPLRVACADLSSGKSSDASRNFCCCFGFFSC